MCSLPKRQDKSNHCSNPYQLAAISAEAEPRTEPNSAQVVSRIKLARDQLERVAWTVRRLENDHFETAGILRNIANELEQSHLGR